MAAKIISQRKWAKLVSSTGPLAQPPGSIPRASNLLFTTRGSLQIASGSSSIGQLPSPFLSARAIAVFTKYASGSYPLYCVLAAPANSYFLTAPADFSISTDASGPNPAGTYYIAIVAQAVVEGVSVTSEPTVLPFVATHSFTTMNFQWAPQSIGTLFEIFYLTSSAATEGSVLVPPTNGTYSGTFLTASYNGSFSPGTTAIPQTNTSALLQLLIGNVIPPSPTVNFTPITSPPIPAAAPQPAQLLPGDPDFVFDTINVNQQQLFPSLDGGTATATANSTTPSATQTTLAASGWAANPTSTGQLITIYAQVSGSAVVPAGVGGGGSVSYQYSVNGGSTWTQFASFGGGNNTWNRLISFSVPASLLTDISDLQIQIVATAGWGVGAGSVVLTGNLLPPAYVQTSTSSSFSPYGGIPGQADVIPLLVQFAGLEILLLGNGYPPQSCDPTALAAATLTALGNTFQAAYPSWQASVDWVTGSQISQGGYVFTATQGGVSGTAPPTWNYTIGAQTAEGSSGTVIWTCTTAITSIPAPRGAAHAVAYAGSLWLANTSPTTTSDGLDGPTCLKMSDANDPNSWNPVNTAFVGRDDGSQITGLQPFTIAALGISPTGSLCVFKEFQTYQVIGVFGSTSFDIQPAQTNLGCIAARSIQFIPGFGVCRFSHLGFAVFDGINDRLISEDIRPYLFGGVDSESDLTPVDPTYLYLSQSAQTISPPMYLCAMPLSAGPGGGSGTGMMTRLFCYDLVMKAWAVLDLPWAISAMAAQSAGEGYPLVLAGKMDGTIQRMQSGDLTWDTGAADQTNIQWSFRSPDIFGEGSSQRLFFEQVVIRGYGSPAMVKSIVAALWLDGQQLGMEPLDIVPMGGGNLFEVRVSIFRNGQRAHLDVSGNNGGAAGTIDSIDWAVTPKSPLARRIIG